MRLGTIAFLLGVLGVQQLAELPSIVGYVGLVPLLILAWRLPGLRLLAWGVAGFTYATLHAYGILTTELAPELEGRDLTLMGVIASIPASSGRGIRFLFDVEALTYQDRPWPSPGKVRLTWYAGHPPLQVGDQWRLRGRLKRPHGFMNPGGFDYEGWLFRQRIRATGYVRKDPTPQRLSSHWYRHPVDRLRQHLARDIGTALDGSPQAGLLTALAVGDRQGISPEQWQVLRRTGTRHLLAISGLHVGLVAGFGFFLVSGLWRLAGNAPLYWPTPKAGALGALLGATLYAALAGFAIPTQRALVMVGVVAGALLMQRHTTPSQGLAVALLLMLCLDPMCVMEPGFWLSFTAVAIIFYGMSGRLGRGGLWWQWGRLQWLMALGLLPVLLVLFQQVSLVAPLANLIAIPWMSLSVVPLTLLGTFFLNLVPSLGQGLLELAASATGGLFLLLERLAGWELAEWVHHRPPAGALLAAGVGILLLLAPRGLPGRWVGTVWLLPLFLVTMPRPERGAVWLTVLDVGQGLAVVVQTARHVLLFDAGPRFSERFDTGAAVVVPFLRYNGVHRLDRFIISHEDTDHMGGADSVLKEVPVAAILTSTPHRFPEWGALPCTAGQRWRWEGVDFSVLHPPLHSPFARNDSSCVLRIENEAGSILLPADIETAAEAWLLSHQAEALNTDILLAPHHGSATSSGADFVAAVDPDYVVFSAGYRNRFGFPAPQVQARYRQIGARLISTSESGAITFRLPASGPMKPPELYRVLSHRYWHAPSLDFRS